MFKKMILIMLVCVISAILLGCAPTTREVSPEQLATEEWKMKLEQVKQEAYNDAMTVCRQDVEDRIARFLNEIHSKLLYVEMVKAGVINPGQVRLSYVPSQTTSDGQSFAPPSIKMDIMEPPKFMAKDAMEWWKRDEANFCYFFIRSYDSESKALKAVGVIDKPTGVFLSSVPYADDSGKYAVVGKAPTIVCEQAVNFYENKGYRAVRIK